MKKKLKKSVTLGDVIKAVNEVGKTINFIRKDSIDMESHLTNKIGQLKVQAEINHTQVMEKLNKIIDGQEEMHEEVQKLKEIHPKFSHAAI